MSSYPRIAAMKSVEAFRARLRDLSLDLPVDDALLSAPDSPLAQPLDVDGFHIGNRWVIHPMEGWDAELDGQPSNLVRRRWLNFARSGAKWLWGFEAMAVLPEGRANPRATLIDPSTRDSLARLVDEVRAVHRAEVGSDSDLLLGFQITHSGRYSRPRDHHKPEPRILYHHPVLDRRLKLPPDYPLLADSDIRRIIDAYVAAARVAESCGVHFVDVKHCHGYLGHEFLSAHTRPGDYGGPFENRTRFLREVVSGIRAATRHLKIGVRLSAFDFVPFRPDPSLSAPGKLGPGVPEPHPAPYPFAFGADPSNPTRIDLTEPARFLDLLSQLGIRMVNLSAGSPYYNPHIQRPALFPPSDGYQPPEDPLIGCARQIQAHAQLKSRFPQLTVVGTAYTYFQEYLPHVAQAVVRRGWADAVGIGRMVLSYPTLPRDVLAGRLATKTLCRTFSDCTTAPRNGLISGCYPLDPFYRARPEYRTLRDIKAPPRPITG